MASNDIGKKFETRFRRDWKTSVPNSFLLRLYDNTSGYMSIANVSDFVGYKEPNLFLLECKAHKGASIPFDAMPQVDKMKPYIDIPGVRCGFVCWLYEKDKVFYVPAKVVLQLKQEGEKSVGIRHFETHRIIEIPSKKLRDFMESDYKVLLELEEGD